MIDLILQNGTVLTMDKKRRVLKNSGVVVDAHGGHSFLRFVVRDTMYWIPAMTHTYKHYTTDYFSKKAM